MVKRATRALLSAFVRQLETLNYSINYQATVLRGEVIEPRIAVLVSLPLMDGAMVYCLACGLHCHGPSQPELPKPPTSRPK